MNFIYRPLIPLIWVMLDNLNNKQLIGSPRFQSSYYPTTWVNKPIS